MNKKEEIRRFRRYIKYPVYCSPVWGVITVLFCFYSKKLAFAAGMFTLMYTLLSTAIYHRDRRRLEEDIISFATGYSDMQKRMLEELSYPFAILDLNGRFVWMNKSMSKMIDKEDTYHKSAATIFKEITREAIEKHTEDAFSIPVSFDERQYEGIITRLKEDAAEDTEDIDAGLLSFILRDITEIEELKQEKEDSELVCAILAIDNYEETLDTVESVRRSMVTAVIDRKVNQYFRNTDAIIRKTERDKYFIMFKHKYLSVLEEDKFSILEDAKTIKAGNDNPITFSIGMGFHGDGYMQNAEFARAAYDMALGRGGSQCVLKEPENVSYYGVRGKEIEKNTRVKARVKAQALREMMIGRDNVIIMGHNITDVDAFGAAIGIYCAARETGKKAQIVLNTITSSLRPLVDTFIESEEYPEDMFIDSNTAIEQVRANSLIMVVDTNRPSYTECPRLLELSNQIVVFDHHRQGKEQVENPVLSYIEPYASSTCEMIAEVLQYFSEKVHLNALEADAIYAGILIDTNNFMTKTGVRTFEAAAYLRRNGAEVTRVRKLLREDMGAYKARAEVVRNANVYKNAFAISVCEARDIESPTVVGAQAANELLNIVGIKASFVLTEFNNKIYVSSRSIDEIDVQLIMERLGGGGHLNVAGAQIEGSSVEAVKKQIESILDDLMEEGEIKL